jgi:hypothetical protein
MKTMRILSFSLAFLLFSCGAKHEDKQPGRTQTPTSVKQNKIDSVPAKISALEKLAAGMLASRESYLNDGSTEAEETLIKALVEALKQPGSFENDFTGL